MSKRDEKEYYKLWWKYLRRFDGWNNFCLIFSKIIASRGNDLIRIDSPDAIELLGSDSFLGNSYRFAIGEINWGENCKNDIDSFFDEWWEKYIITGKSIEKDLIKKDHPGIYSISEFIEKFQTNNDRNPPDDFLVIDPFIADFDELKKRVSEIRQKKSNQNNASMLQFFLLVKADLKNKASKILRSKNSDDSFLILNKNLFSYAVICGMENELKIDSLNRIRVDELKRYLEVYDRFIKKININDIIKEMGTEAQREGLLEKDMKKYVHDQFQSDYKKAKAIIENVRNGVFPGIY